MKIHQKISEINIDKFVMNKNFNNFYICYRKYFTAKMQQLLHDPDYFLDNVAERFFKNDEGDTTTIGVVKIDGWELVVKRYNIKGFWHFLKKCWRQSKAIVSWGNAHYLKKAEIDTVEPVAVVEKRFGFLRHKAYFISEYAHGIRGCDYFGKEIEPTPKWNKVIAHIIEMIEKMRIARIEHQDFQYGNLLIVEDKPLLLDLDHMKIHRRSNQAFRRALERDIEHFLSFLRSNSSATQMFLAALDDAKKRGGDV